MPSLVVCPTSLILNWGDELARFAPQLQGGPHSGSSHGRKRQMGVLRRLGPVGDLPTTF